MRTISYPFSKNHAINVTDMVSRNKRRKGGVVCTLLPIFLVLGVLVIGSFISSYANIHNHVRAKMPPVFSAAQEQKPPSTSMDYSHLVIYLIGGGDGGRAGVVAENLQVLVRKNPTATTLITTTPSVTTDQVIEWLEEGLLNLSNSSSIPSNNTGIKVQLAGTLSHLVAIRQAYNAGHETVVIVDQQQQPLHQPKIEEIQRNVVSKRSGNHNKNGFDWHQLWDHIEKAPLDWHALQLVTENNIVQQHLDNLKHKDPWISWQQDHGGSTTAYLLSRKGMQQILSRTLSHSHDVLQQGRSVWTFPEPSMISSNDVIFYQVNNNAYTSTRMNSSLLLDGGPTIQATLVRSESILVLMSVLIKSIKALEDEMDRIRQDYHALCSIHRPTSTTRCDWVIKVVLSENSLLDQWNTTLKKEKSWAEKVHFQVNVTWGRFNKFGLVNEYTNRMGQYDKVLLKDNDQRIAGFPWNTFMDKAGNATVVGPLRQHRETSLLKRKWVDFPIHQGSTWKQQLQQGVGEFFISSMYTSIVPVPVALIEMFFVLMRGDFAEWFFSKILTADFVRQTASWGPDLMWCPAARDFAPYRVPCLLVPVITTHEDTKQIDKKLTVDGENLFIAGSKAVKRFQKNPVFRRWIGVSKKWQKITQEASLGSIKKRCQSSFRDLRGRGVFTIEECAKRVFS